MTTQNETMNVGTGTSEPQRREASVKPALSREERYDIIADVARSLARRREVQTRERYYWSDRDTDVDIRKLIYGG